MAFHARPNGRTLGRIEEYVHRPHHPAERLDPDFRVAMRCQACGKVGYGPRSQIAEAIREHRETCSARRTKADEPQLTRILFPRQ